MPRPPANPTPLPEKEWQRLFQLTMLEEEVRRQGFKNIVGVDEVGRGAVAGPVVACACCLEKGIYIEGVNDSKKLSPLKREKIAALLKETRGVSFSFGVVDAKVIDEVNIYQATKLAHLEALTLLAKKMPVDFIFVDGNMPLAFGETKVQTVVQGDALVYSIAAASILAKVERDRMMRAFDQDYPQYGFKDHKGYFTEKHREMYAKHGVSEIHRLSFV